MNNDNKQLELTEQQSSERLDQKTIAQLKWKSEVTQVISVLILRACLQQNIKDAAVPVYPDTIDFTSIPESSRNCIGTTFRTLRKLDMIEETGTSRKSKALNAGGRRVFGYRIKRPSLANALIARYGGVRLDKQQQLPIGDNK